MSIHINAEKEDIAKVVLMPGDPLRAKYIASKYLKNVKEVTNVRNILGFTGEYNGRRVTVMASGMGIPSIGIYAYELFHDYDVDTIIRVGTCGAYSKNLKPKDVVIVDKAYTDSNFAYNYNGEKKNVSSSNTDIVHKLVDVAKNSNIKAICGNILSSEVFYRNNNFYQKFVDENKVIGVEMESFALFYLGEVLNKQTGCILTVSDCIYPNDYGILSVVEKEKCLDEMITIALNSI